MGPKTKRCLKILAALLAMLLVAFVAFVYYAAKVSLDVENDSHRYVFLCKAIAEYRIKNGKMPGEDRDLMRVEIDWGWLQWPRDQEKIMGLFDVKYDRLGSPGSCFEKAIFPKKGVAVYPVVIEEGDFIIEESRITPPSQSRPTPKN